MISSERTYPNGDKSKMIDENTKQIIYANGDKFEGKFE